MMGPVMTEPGRPPHYLSSHVFCTCRFHFIPIFSSGITWKQAEILGSCIYGGMQRDNFPYLILRPSGDTVVSDHRL